MLINQQNISIRKENLNKFNLPILLNKRDKKSMNSNQSQSVKNPQRCDSKSQNFFSDVLAPQQSSIPLKELISKLESYRDIKSLPMNPVSEQKQQLWRDSPCCTRYPNRHVSLDKVKRFQVGSIYYKDDINQNKKVFTDSEKPQLMLKNFRRQIQDATFSKRKYTQKFKKLSPHKIKSNSVHGATLPLFSNTLYQVPPKIELKYDRNGTRSTYTGQYEVKDIIERFRSSSSNFTSSKRVDLGLPLNFNPGPGKYFTKSEQFSKASTKRSTKAKLFNNTQTTTGRLVNKQKN